MNAQVNRMQFLRGDFKGKESPIRPPWAIDENLFTEICTGCGDCLTRCPTHIIKQGRGNYPVIDFSAGECTFCESCADVCQVKALLKSDMKSPWSIKASINEAVCITYQGVECRSCYDPCETRAIKMPPRLGGISIPILDLKNCTGCGACFSVCPVQAIELTKTIDTTFRSHHS